MMILSNDVLHVNFEVEVRPPNTNIILFTETKKFIFVSPEVQVCYVIKVRSDCCTELVGAVGCIVER